MSRYKRLDPPYFAKSNDEFFREVWIKPEERIDPIFHKPGIYLDRVENRCWCEANGVAWLYEREMFDYELRIEFTSERLLSKVERDAINLLLRRNTFTGRTRRALASRVNWDWQFHDLRNVRRETRKALMVRD